MKQYMNKFTDSLVDSMPKETYLEHLRNHQVFYFLLKNSKLIVKNVFKIQTLTLIMKILTRQKKQIIVQNLS